MCIRDSLEDGPTTVSDAEFERIAAHFTPPAWETLPAADPAHAARLTTDKAFANWVKRCVQAHKTPGYAAVTLSLKAPGVAPGDITDTQMVAVADLADRFSFGELRVSHEQNVVLADVRQSDLYEVWQLSLIHI